MLALSVLSGTSVCLNDGYCWTQKHACALVLQTAKNILVDIRFVEKTRGHLLLINLIWNFFFVRDRKQITVFMSYFDQLHRRQVSLFLPTGPKKKQEVYLSPIILDVEHDTVGSIFFQPVNSSLWERPVSLVGLKCKKSENLQKKETSLHDGMVCEWQSRWSSSEEWVV